MKKLCMLLLTALCVLGVNTGVQAQAQPAGDDALYRRFGEKPGLVALMDDFMLRLMADPRMRPFFEPAKRDHVKEQLVEQFCMLTGGPCVYKGVDMKNAHTNMDVNKANFNALVEVLQQSMDARGIPFTAQNQLLAKLAPMHRDIINTP